MKYLIKPGAQPTQVTGSQCYLCVTIHNQGSLMDNTEEVSYGGKNPFLAVPNFSVGCAPGFSY
jgi:hypothetical protein